MNILKYSTTWRRISAVIMAIVLFCISIWLLVRQPTQDPPSKYSDNVTGSALLVLSLLISFFVYKSYKSLPVNPYVTAMNATS